MAHAARALGLGVMLGCMVESGLGIAAGCVVAPSATTSTSTATSSWWDAARRRVRRRRPGAVGPAGARCQEALPILAEGFSGDPHYGKTARACSRTGSGRSWRSSTRAGPGAGRGVPIVGSVAEGLRSPRRRRSSVSPRRAAASRPPGARSCARRSKAAFTSRTACTSSSPATRSWHRSRRRGVDCATCAAAAGAEHADRGQPRAAGPDRAHGRLGLRDREDDRLARARPCAPARAGSLPSSRPGRPGSRSQGEGIAVDAVVHFLAGATEQLVVEGHERGGELLMVEGQGSRSSRLLGRHARAPARRRAALVLCHMAGEREIEGCGPSAPAARRARRPARADVAAGATRDRGGDRLAARRRGGSLGGRGGGGRDGPARRRPRSLRPDRLLDAVLATLA